MVTYCSASSSVVVVPENIVGLKSIVDAPVGYPAGSRVRGFVNELTRDVESGNGARMVLRVLTFWGNRYIGA